MLLTDFLSKEDMNEIFRIAEHEEIVTQASRKPDAKIDDSGILVLSILPGLLEKS